MITLKTFSDAFSTWNKLHMDYFKNKVSKVKNTPSN
jgi:hypothetical protein